MISAILRSKLLVIAIIIVVLGAAWYGLTSSSPSSSQDSALTGSAPDNTGDGAIVQKLNALQTISLTGAVFSEPSYPTLKDYTTAIIPVPAGRPDPFAPLPGQAAASSPTSTSTKSVQIFKAPK